MRKLRISSAYFQPVSLLAGFVLLVVTLFADSIIQALIGNKLNLSIQGPSVGMLAFYFLIGVITRADWTHGAKISSLFLAACAIAGPLAIVVTWRLNISTDGNELNFGVGLLWGVTVFVYLFYMASAALNGLRNVVRRWSGFGPDALAVDRCLILLTTLRMEGHRWSELAWRRRVAIRVESIAQSIEVCGTLMRRVGDNTSSAWIQQRMAGIAAGIRDKKRWLAMPKADTRDQFALAIGQIFIALVNCDWDSLPQQESSTLTRRDLFRVVLQRLRSVLISVLVPAALFLGIQYSSFSFGSPARDYVIGFLLLWILVVVLSAVDPLYQSRIEAFRNLTQIFPFAKKEK